MILQSSTKRNRDCMLLRNGDSFIRGRRNETKPTSFLILPPSSHPQRSRSSLHPELDSKLPYANSLTNSDLSQWLCDWPLNNSFICIILIIILTNVIRTRASKIVSIMSSLSQLILHLKCFSSTPSPSRIKKKNCQLHILPLGATRDRLWPSNTTYSSI